MRFPGIPAALALASLASGVSANPAFGKQGHPHAVAPGKVTETGVCGKTNGFICTGSSFGQCYSASGRCGSSVSFCGEGCQSNYGSCGALAITSYAESAPLERLKSILKNIGLSRHHWKLPHNGTWHANNGTFGTHNGTSRMHNRTHPGHRGFHKHNVTRIINKGPKKGLGARDAEGEVAPRCACVVEGEDEGEIAARCEGHGTNVQRRAPPTGIGAPTARPTGAPGLRGHPPTGTAPQPTGTNTRGTPNGRFGGPPPHWQSPGCIFWDAASAPFWRPRPP